MHERVRFVTLHRESLYSMTELCQRFGISRRIGYKWLARCAAGGFPALEDQRRVPRSCPHRTSKAVEAALVQLRKQHPTWGPKKLLARLRQAQPELELPAVSTAGAILKRHELVPEGRRRRSRPEHPGGGPLRVNAPNQVWTADFKGEFPTRDGQLCYPLTICDAHSRFLLVCHALSSTALAGAEPVFTRLFAAYGLPQAIRTDNGPPFASSALGGLSRLNAGWTRLGIHHQRIDPGHPEQNGRHERLHRTLKAETTRPPEPDLLAQQARFERFRAEYNEVRPHEALAQEPPAAHYQGSTRPLPARTPTPEYEGHLLVRRVRPNGSIKLWNQELFVSSVLIGEQVALEEIDDGVWSVYYYRLLLGRLDVRKWQIR
jgi:putative transposase